MKVERIVHIPSLKIWNRRNRKDNKTKNYGTPVPGKNRRSRCSGGLGIVPCRWAEPGSRSGCPSASSPSASSRSKPFVPRLLRPQIFLLFSKAGERQWETSGTLTEGRTIYNKRRKKRKSEIMYRPVDATSWPGTLSDLKILTDPYVSQMKMKVMSWVTICE